jgi:outer membrane protein TolC
MSSKRTVGKNLLATVAALVASGLGLPLPGGAAEAVAAPEVAVVTLEQALQDLETRSPALSQARSRAAEAQGLASQAASALIPALAVTGNYTRNSDEAALPLGRLAALAPALANVLPGDVVIQPLSAFTASAALRVPLLVPTAWAELGAAKQAASAAETSADAVRLQLRAALIQAAWAGAAGEEIVAASERAAIVAEEQVRSSERAVQAGTAAHLSVLQAQTQATQRQSDLVRAHAELERARLGAGILLGRAEPVRVTLGDFAAASGAEPPEALDSLASAALAHRPELQAQQALVRSASGQVDSARWRLAPQLAASGAAFASTVAYPTGKKEGWRVGLELTWQLFDGGFRAGKRAQAEASLAGARAAEEAQRLGIAQEVQDAARDLRVARERLQLAERQRALAAEAAATAKRSFDGGVAGSIDVLDANDRLFQAEVGLASARAGVGIAKASLDRALGRT